MQLLQKEPLLSIILKEAESFSTRNAIVTLQYLEKRKTLKQCCQRCLKAHLLKTLIAHKYDKERVESLFRLMNSEIGHNGYYMDQDKLIKI